MLSLLQSIDKLTRIGVSEAASQRSQFQTRAANVVGLAFALLSLPYVPLEYFLGAPKLALATLLSCFVFLLSIPLNYLGLSRLARAAPLVAGTAMAWIVAQAVSPAGQVQVVFFMMGLWAFALYDARTEWPELLMLQLLPAAAYLSLSAGFQPVVFDWQPEPELVEAYAQAMPATTFVLNSAFLFLFYRRNQVNEDRLVEAVTELKSAHQLARAGEQAKAEFLAVMSHEIRTPLNGVLGCAQLIEREPLSPGQKELLSTLTSSAESLLDLMAAVLDYTQLDNGRARLIEASVDAAALVDDAVESFADAAAERGVRLWFCPAPAVPPTLRLDPGRLRLVAASLVSNAVKFTKEGHIGVELGFEPRGDGRGELSLAVSDTGAGIAAESQEAIFERFHQLDRFAQRLEGGMGLGLAVARSTAVLMNGSLRVESISGVGSRFTLTIPTQEVPALVQTDQVDRVVPSVRLAIEDQAHAAALRLKLERWGHRVVSDQSNECADVLLIEQHQWLAAETAEERHPELLVVVLSDPRLPKPEDVASVGWYLRRGPWAWALARYGALLSVAPDSAKQAKSEAPPAESPDTGGGPKSRSSRSSPLRAGKIAAKVLIAEDQPMSREVLARMAAVCCDEVRTVGDGKQAVEAWRSWEPTVILMDVQMPVMDGLEAVRAIRRQENGEGRTPIIAITANALPEQRAEGLRAGMDLYLSKPVRLGELQDAIAQVCTRFG